MSAAKREVAYVDLADCFYHLYFVLVGTCSFALKSASRSFSTDDKFKCLGFFYAIHKG